MIFTTFELFTIRRYTQPDWWSVGDQGKFGTLHPAAGSFAHFVNIVSFVDVLYAFLE